MKLLQIRQMCKDNIKVISNYSHMTILQVMNSFFYILIYPFVINNVGIENYGLYVFATSIAAYFMVFVTFGFDMHAAKLISLNPNDAESQASLFSSMLVAKLCLSVVAIVVFIIILLSVPFMRANLVLFTLCFSNILSCVFLPVWYFHGMQKMKNLTTVQLSFKLISLPIIYFAVNDVGDIDFYAAIVVVTNIFAAIIAFGMAVRLSRVSLRVPSRASVIGLLYDVQPFFWSSATNTLKQKSIEIIIGSFFGMKEVAVYDLANKIFSVPSLLASNINSALFPVMIKKATKDIVNKIIKVELFIGLLCMLAVAVGGYWVVKLVSVHNMQDAYYLSMLLSVNVMTFLVVGSHIYFVFVPHQRYDLVLRNQLVSIVTFYLFCIVYLSIVWSVYSVVLALVTSALLEIVYSYTLVSKVKSF